MPPVHPHEAEQVARIRSYKIESGGKTYHIYRGDLHRHTDISGDGVGDGSLMDLHRYALDAAALDFIIVTDHNMGDDNEYSWWRTQKANDLYTVPGAFISMYGYERSVPYPNGHRNVIWPERGHRTLPLPQADCPSRWPRTPAKLYAYLRQTDGICTSHTSATDQGTDWAEHDDRAGAVRRNLPGLPRLLRGARRPEGGERQDGPDSRPIQAGRLRVAGAGQGLPARLPVVERPHLDARQLSPASWPRSSAARG